MEFIDQISNKSRAHKISRRDLLKMSITSACATGLFLMSGKDNKAYAQTESTKIEDDSKYIIEARYYEKLPESRVKCVLCPRECTVADMERGGCGVRENHQGIYRTLVYSRVCSLNIDPIEKKPLFHYLPGTTALSLATAGCNIECKFCQNWEISQFRPEEVRAAYLPPEAIAEAAKKQNTPTIAYTYSEPVIFYEYMFDTAKAGHKLGIKSVMISNGYIQEKPLRELCSHLDAVKIDFKGYTENFYKEYCGGELKPVLNTLKLLKEIGIWFEMVDLIVPTLNDSEKEIDEMTKWIMDNLGPDVPLHFTRFHPAYKIKNLPSTPLKTIERCYDIATKNGLHYVYIGNIPGHKGEKTFCPNCKTLLIDRIGFYIQSNKIKDNKCPSCQTKIPGKWS